MSKPIAVGIVGLGRAGWGMHCKELENKGEKFKIVAACDEIEERREKIREKFGCQVYATIEELVADSNVELVDIATRSCDHLKHAKLALSTGKSVYLEKPICTSYDEARELEASASKADGELYIRHNRRVDPDFLHVQQIIASGILGDVFEIRLARHGYQRRDDWQTIKEFGGGQLLNWGPHIIDHALRFVGGKVKSQFSELRKVTAVGDAEDHVKIVIEGESGLVVDLEISGGVALGEPQYRVFGSRGSLSLDGNDIALKYLDPDTPLAEKQANPGTPGTTFGSTEELVWIEKTIPVQSGSNDVLWDSLFETIRNGAEFPVKLAEAVQVMEVASKAKIDTSF